MGNTAVSKSNVGSNSTNIPYLDRGLEGVAVTYLSRILIDLDYNSFMRKYKNIDQETEIGIVAKFNKAALKSGFSVFDLFYDGKSFFRHIVEDNYFEEIFWHQNKLISY